LTMSKGFAHVSLVGNLSRDPELRQTAGGTSVCQLGVAVGYSYKDSSGQWVDKPSFFDVTVWGPQGEACAKYLTKGRQVAVSGRLDQQTWEAQDGSKRSKVGIVADQVVFLGGGQKDGQQAAKPAAARDDFKDIDFGDEGEVPF
jgi:single-strand DNA-binding protein